jgi:DNA-binding PadR family transcriptional regulator
VRRKQGVILPLEAAILEAAVELSMAGEERFHGFMLAKHLRDAEGAKLLTAHGTLYKALARLEKADLLVSVWEDPAVAAEESRPRRRLYEITAAGRAALARVRAEPASGLRVDPGWSPS